MSPLAHKAFHQLQRQVEEFLTKAPSFSGSEDLEKKIRQSFEDLEAAIDEGDPLLDMED